MYLLGETMARIQFSLHRGSRFTTICQKRKSKNVIARIDVFLRVLNYIGVLVLFLFY